MRGPDCAATQTASADPADDVQAFGSQKVRGSNPQGDHDVLSQDIVHTFLKAQVRAAASIKLPPAASEVRCRELRTDRQGAGEAAPVPGPPFSDRD
jgi:hypothetical protein